MRTAAVVMAAFTLCGCMGGPREAELTLDIGPTVVRLDARLRDIRLFTGDEVLQAATFVGFVDADSARKSLGGEAAAITATTWAWSIDGDVTNLHIVATLPREQFDACVAERLPHARLPCSLVPLWKDKGELVSSLSEPEVAKELEARGPVRWPVATTHLKSG